MTDRLPAVHRLRDGTAVRLRLIGPADRARLAAGFAELSPASRYRRFFSAMPRLPESLLRKLTETDGWNHIAIGAEAADGDPETARGLGVAHLFRLADAPETAEVAIAVIDQKQGLGLGHLLLRELVHVARARGIEQFRGVVLRDNTAVQALLADVGEATAPRDEGDYLVYDIPLPAADEEDVHPGPLYRFLKRAAEGLEFVLHHLPRVE